MQQEKNCLRLAKNSKRSLRSSVKWPACVKPSSLSTAVLMLMNVLCWTSCRTSRVVLSGERTDSVRATSSLVIEQRNVVEPARLDTPAVMSIAPQQIDSLPTGAEYSVQTPQARASLRKQADGGVTLSAQGISPAKVETTTKASAESGAKSVSEDKPPEFHLNTDKTPYKWWTDGFVLLSLIVGVVFVGIVLRVLKE